MFFRWLILLLLTEKYHAFGPGELDLHPAVSEELHHGLRPYHHGEPSEQMNPDEFRVKIEDPDRAMQDGTASSSSHLEDAHGSQSTATSEDQCPICLSNEGEMMRGWECKHLIHKKCLNKWITNEHSWPTCAVCRRAKRAAGSTTKQPPAPPTDGTPFPGYTPWHGQAHPTSLAASQQDAAIARSDHHSTTSVNEARSGWRRLMPCIAVLTSCFTIAMIVIVSMFKAQHM
ncbi:hypothetical protein PGTUg99_018611 [Puccinia graminis f. sp. tritici]|uniref:RING-type domain-containing protein n=1 Tax=Puccinia graminis f. sp. tritici TaxID=56615 RepID=A0A5B0Q185_PUCGR|nr:hypothetical protein PGTUg99_018611 [Puccinia graminis f. sp. tritici]